MLRLCPDCNGFLIRGSRGSTAVGVALEFCYTPKQGSWLNIAENELSSMTHQFLRGRRLGELEELQAEIAAWWADVRGCQRGVDWQMSMGEARGTLKSMYSKIIS